MAMTACEIGKQPDLLVGEGTDLPADQRERANQFIVLEQRNREDGPIARFHAGRYKWMVVGRERPDIGDLDHLLGDCEASQGRVRWWPQQRITRARLDVGGGVVVCSNHAKGICVVQVEISENGLADARCALQHGLEYRSQLAGRGADNPQHLRRGFLSLQRFVALTDELRHVGLCFGVCRGWIA